MPASPGAWLTTVARRIALNALARRRVATAKLPLLLEPEATETTMPVDDPAIPDDRLRLIFTCCHPALAPEAQVALTLRLVCGVATPDIAQAFLVSEPTMAARLTRAKKKVAAAHIPYAVPEADELPARLDAVLTVVHLLYTTGYAAPSGRELVRGDLTARALELARLVAALLPGEREALGLLALLVVNDARRATRTDDAGPSRAAGGAGPGGLGPRGHRGGAPARRRRAGGRPAGPLRAAGRHRLAARARAELRRDRLGPDRRAVRRAASGSGPRPSWPSTAPSPVRRSTGPAAGLAEVEALEAGGELAGYRYLPGTKADLLRRLGRLDEAAAAYREALALAENEAERAFLERRLAECGR